MSKGAAGYSNTKVGEDFVLINSLTLVTSIFDPIGICLDPLAASINHSCLPNAAVTFDGAQLSLRSLREIEEHGEITISYIENTDPYNRRQRLLAHQYFFSCACVKCQHGPTLREDRFLGEEIDIKNLKDLEDNMFLILAKAGTEEDTTTAIPQLLEAMRKLKGSASWPMKRQPWPEIRRVFAVNYVRAGRWTEALPHLLTLYFHIDPVLLPEPWHPLRVVHNWFLVMLFLQLASLSVSDLTSMKLIERYQIDYGKVIWGLAQEVEANVDKSHGSKSSFALLVKRKVEELRVDMTRNGAAAVHLTGRDWLEEEWTKLRAIAEIADTGI
ncbi:MAG: hypothetical protein M1816_006872 [Peltula sp. TS41687]|nr:MAG: hypothetical protein M1816_006872 [Peltula sp. TS41687]